LILPGATTLVFAEGVGFKFGLRVINFRLSFDAMAINNSALPQIIGHDENASGSALIWA
jgi:hypothetical protein